MGARPVIWLDWPGLWFWLRTGNPRGGPMTSDIVPNSLESKSPRRASSLREGEAVGGWWLISSRFDADPIDPGAVAGVFVPSLSWRIDMMQLASDNISLNLILHVVYCSRLSHEGIRGRRLGKRRYGITLRYCIGTMLRQSITLNAIFHVYEQNQFCILRFQTCALTQGEVGRVPVQLRPNVVSFLRWILNVVSRWHWVHVIYWTSLTSFWNIFHLTWDHNGV
jgi:hypothetical protein